MHFFDRIPETPEDPIFGLVEAFKKDPRQEKLFLGMGVYRNEELEPVILKAVKAAERELLEIEKSKEYLPIAGDDQFLESLGALLFGRTVWDSMHSKIVSVQTVGGTGALRLGADFLKSQKIANDVVISDPSWPNHRGIFSRAGFGIGTYPYYDFERKGICYEEMCKLLKQLEPRTVAIFQASCHNPTGMDLNDEQWKEVAHITKAQGLIPFFDCAYQGFDKGVEHDLSCLTHFIETGQEFIVAYSCSKNFSLYYERVGALFVILLSESEKHRVQNALKALIRNIFSNPPAHGAKIVAKILKDVKLTNLWMQELKEMRENCFNADRIDTSSRAAFDCCYSWVILSLTPGNKYRRVFKERKSDLHDG